MRDEAIQLVADFLRKHTTWESKANDLKGPDLIVATMANNINAARVFLALGCHPDAKNESGQTALVYAAIYGYADFVKLFLKHGADPNAADVHGGTPTSYANERINKKYPEYEEIYNLLVKHGGNSTAKNR